MCTTYLMIQVRQCNWKIAKLGWWNFTHCEKGSCLPNTLEHSLLIQEILSDMQVLYFSLPQRQVPESFLNLALFASLLPLFYINLKSQLLVHGLKNDISFCSGILPVCISITKNILTAHNWQKWKKVFLTCLCHKIYRVEAVGLKSPIILDKLWCL